MRRFTPWLIAALAFVTLLAVAMFITRDASKSVSGKAEKQLAGGGATTPKQRCASGRTYDSIKLELFRSAAQTRGSDRAAFDRISAYSVVRMERPLLTGYDQELGTTRCTGRLSLDLPPGLAVVGGRRTLSADIDYVVQPAADGSGDVVVLEGGDPVVIPLATLARSGSDQQLASNLPAPVSTTGLVEGPSQAQPSPPRQETAADAYSGTPTSPTAQQNPTTVRRVEAKPPAPPKALPAAAPSTQAKPSFNCRYARTGGEKAICSNARLASLDRQMASQYYRAVASGDARQRQLLASTRNDFLRRRDRCQTEACIAASYRERMREIAEVSRR